MTIIKVLVFTVSMFICKNLFAENHLRDSFVNPLVRFSSLWADKKYNSCNTAKSVNYLTEEEKNVIWVLNMARYNPQLFLKTVLLNPKCNDYVVKEKRSQYFKSLMEDLQYLKPNTTLLQPDSGAFISAQCHAIQSGKNGYVGHERNGSDCKSDFYGECCDYGNGKALDILLNLLIDEGIESVGHRKICLSVNYDKIGVSIQPHQIYGINTVMDFK